MTSQAIPQEIHPETHQETSHEISFAIKEKLLGNHSLDVHDYQTIYDYSITHKDDFWAAMADQLAWIKKPSIIKNTDYNMPVNIKWYEDGILNICYNCVDRHAQNTPDKTALIYEGNDEALVPNALTDPSIKDPYNISYKTLLTKVCQFANALKSRNVTKGDTVIIYMPMIPDAVMSMLACARIGAVHCVVFGGFSPEALKQRIIDSGAKTIITADYTQRGKKPIPLKQNVDHAIQDLDFIDTVFVHSHMNENDDYIHNSQDIHLQNFMAIQDEYCEYAPINAEDPLFILYTSGSTGKPKGIVHTSAGYLVYTALTFKTVFDYKPNDIFWCTADVGWITGHSYCVYGALANGATTVIFNGIPTYPDASRFWKVIDKHNISIFYTAPTAIRALMAQGEAFLETTHRSSLRILGSVGEPINKEAWDWYYQKIGHAKCPIVDTWWQTETGGHLITPLPCFTQKPSAAMKPFFGIEPVLISNDGDDQPQEGKLCFKDSWPSAARTIYKDHARFEQTYFHEVKGFYFSGDGAKKDADGDYYITGRMDDVLNISGHRLGTAEIEDAINLHNLIAESAVVGVPHPIKGESIFAYVTLKKGSALFDLKKEVSDLICQKIGAIARPDQYLIVEDLPKTRSGKIMRRILRKIAVDKFDALGDLSTLADDKVISKIIDAKNQKRHEINAS